MKLIELVLTKKQRDQAETLNPKDGSEFTVLGQIMVGDDPRAGTLYCYQLNRKQYDAIAPVIKKTLGIA